MFSHLCHIAHRDAACSFVSKSVDCVHTLMKMLRAASGTSQGVAMAPAPVRIKSGESKNNLRQFRSILPGFRDSPPARPPRFATTNCARCVSCILTDCTETGLKIGGSCGGDSRTNCCTNISECSASGPSSFCARARSSSRFRTSAELGGILHRIQQPTERRKDSLGCLMNHAGQMP